MKKLVCIILALLIIFSAVSCKSIDDVVENSPEIDTGVENKPRTKTATNLTQRIPKN